MLKRKLVDKGVMCCFNTRLVGIKFVEKKGIGYSETFALFVLIELLLLLVQKFILKWWYVHHANNSPDFLNDDIDGELYVIWDGVVYELQKKLFTQTEIVPLLRYKNLDELPRSFGFE